MNRLNRICLILISILLFMTPCRVYASSAEKTVKVELPQDYVQCTFYVSFEKELLQDTILISPTGDSYSFTEDEDGNLSCTVKNAKKGTWKVVATKTTEEETELTDEDIGKITVSVKSEAESASEVSDNIKIAKEIANLRIYFKDDSLVTEWDDESCGDVDVTIINSDNLKVITQKTVQSQYLETPIPEGTKEILVNIVPAASNNVKGAGDQYVFKVENQPKAKIIFDPLEYTNKNTLHAAVELEEEYRLIFYTNDKETGQTEILEAGNHDIEVPISNGSNEIKVYVVDSKGNMRSTSATVIMDITPPVLMMNNDINGTKTYDGRIKFSGTVDDFDQLLFRNDGVFVDWDGTFEIDASLKDGENTLELKAVDIAGNEAVYIATVTKLVKEPVIFPFKQIIIIATASIVILFLVIKKRRNIRFSELLNFLHKGKNKKEKGTIYPIEYIYIAVLILIVYFLFHSILLNVVIKSSSMEPTIKTGELTIFNQLSYINRKPERGDIVAITSDEYQQIMVKRIIGLPGDEISFVDGYVIINGQVCNETYLSEDIETNSSKSFIVPDKCYFLLGDNRENSNDARYWSDPYIEDKKIKGRMILHMDIINQIKELFT